MKWYHGTPRVLEAGTILSAAPQRGERRRFKESAKDAVSITSSLDVADFWSVARGNEHGYIYEVEPIGKIDVISKVRRQVWEARVPRARVLRLVRRVSNPSEHDIEAKVRASVQRCMEQCRWQERLPGGTTRHPSEFEYESLVRGTLAELEHTIDPCIAMEIAMDHLDEDPAYYEPHPRRRNPQFSSYEEAQEWIDAKSNEYGGKDRFLSSAEYKHAYPEIRRLHTQATSSHAAKRRGQASSMGVAEGTRVQYTSVSSFGLAETFTGRIVYRKDVPWVKLDKKVDGKASIRWDPRWTPVSKNPQACGSGCVLAKHAWQPGETSPEVRRAARELADIRWTLSPREARIKASLLR